MPWLYACRVFLDASLDKEGVAPKYRAMLDVSLWLPLGTDLNPANYNNLRMAGKTMSTILAVWYWIRVSSQNLAEVTDRSDV